MPSLDRREFLIGSAGALGAMAAARRGGAEAASGKPAPEGALTLFLGGDVMTGRGIDQLLATPSEPWIYEPYVRDARRYVGLAEEVSGPIARPVAEGYVWGEALAELERRGPEARIVNLETAVTRSDDYWRGKGINYRMHPANVGCLTVAGIDCCTLANNHVLDWGYDGLRETVATLREAGIATVGAGVDRAAAEAPAFVETAGEGKVAVFSFGLSSSGIPREWAAAEGQPGIALLPDLSDATAGRVAGRIAAAQRPGDRVVASIHWGGNWGYAISEGHRRFARRLIEAGGVDVVHGHSSHHALGIEVHRERPILYGCGDLINDYEGIGGQEAYRGDLALAYFVTLDRADGRLLRLEMAPFRSRRLRLRRASRRDRRWLAATLTREGEGLGTRVEPSGANGLELFWE